MKDTLQRFLFEHAPVRGGLVRLDDSWQAILSRKNYPAALRHRLGELAAAAALLAATIKFDGTLILQLQGQGVLKLLVVEVNAADRTLRATARWDGEVRPDATLAELLGAGQFVITLDPNNGADPYQGIVALEGGSVADMLGHYMQSSEQLDTFIRLAASDYTAAGLLLQKLPDGHGDEDGWPRATQLAATLKDEELLGLAADDILHRLYHQEDVRLFEPEKIAFQCSCSAERVGGMLKLLGRAEVDDIVAEQGSVEIACDFCHQTYVFDEDDVEALFSPDDTPDAPVRH